MNTAWKRTELAKLFIIPSCDVMDNCYPTAVLRRVSSAKSDFVRFRECTLTAFKVFQAHMLLICTMPAQLAKAIMSVSVKSVHAESNTALAC